MKLPKYFYYRVHWDFCGSEIEVEDASDVDVVEVVRCCECKHNPKNTWFECPMFGSSKKTDDTFCSFGERKEDA